MKNISLKNKRQLIIIDNHDLEKKSDQYNLMAHKVVFKDYTVFVTIKSDNHLSIMVANNLMPGHYVNDSVQLIRIKADTVIAALQEKNQKYIKCDFKFKSFENEEHERLILTILVHYDFLPQFKEEISLQFIKEKNQTMNRIQAVSFETQIADLYRKTDYLGKGDPLNYHLSPLFTFTDGGLIGTLNVEKGKYLLQLSGFCASTTGYPNIEHISFTITHSEDQKLELPPIKPYINTSYSYPYNLSQLIQVSKSGKLQISCKGNPYGNTISLHNNFIIASPVISIN